MNNIILIGFMGSGKSTVGFRLSYRLRKTLIDTDKQIERDAGKTIKEIFADEGEEFFRDLETQCLEKLLKTSRNQIISVGGGLPVREKNRKLLRRIGKVIYLRISPKEVYERVKHDTVRPLLQTENPLERIEQLMEIRDPLYEKAAHLIIDVDGLTMEEVLFEIEKKLKKKEHGRFFGKKEKRKHENFNYKRTQH